MDNISIQAPAKINLYLDVLGKRTDGYHDLKMIMQTVNLCDEICVAKAEKGIRLKIEGGEGIPEGEENTAFKAAKLMINSFGLKQGVSILIKKKIPAAAGLAGGSSDAAAVMKGMNQLFGLSLDRSTLAQLGKQVGADVPFCIIGGTAAAEGIGEVITTLEPFSGIDIVLVKPDFDVSTAEVFKKYSSCESRCKPEINNLIQAMRERDIKKAGLNLFNALEAVTAREFMVINEIKDIMNRGGAAGSLMSGSGSSVFGLFNEFKQAQSTYKVLKDKFKSTYLLKTC